MSSRHMPAFVAILGSLIVGVASAQHIVPSALLTIDQNRPTVVDRIVSQWGDRLASSSASLTTTAVESVAATEGLRSAAEACRLGQWHSQSDRAHFLQERMSIESETSTGRFIPGALGCSVAS